MMQQLKWRKAEHRELRSENRSWQATDRSWELGKCQKATEELTGVGYELIFFTKDSWFASQWVKPLLGHLHPFSESASLRLGYYASAPTLCSWPWETADDGSGFVLVIHLGDPELLAFGLGLAQPCLMGAEGWGKLGNESAARALSLSVFPSLFFSLSPGLSNK